MHLDFGIDTEGERPSVYIWANRRGLARLSGLIGEALATDEEEGPAAEMLLGDGCGGTTHLKIWIEEDE